MGRDVRAELARWTVEKAAAQAPAQKAQNRACLSGVSRSST